MQREQNSKHAAAAKKREERRNEAFIPPEEPGTSKGNKGRGSGVDVAALKEKILKARKNTKIFSKEPEN